jgi:predicted GH43/DUF377 family glycosyl hydrolase
MKAKCLIFLLFASFQLPLFADLNPTEQLILDPADYHWAEEEDCPQELIDPSFDLLDLEEMAQDFVLETKRIEFSDYPGAFNPSIIRWRGCLLMSFRVYNQKTRSANPFALVWLNENLDPISTPQVFELPYNNPVLPSKQQDPRLVTVEDRLFIVYNNQQEDITHREMRRMFIVEMDFDGEKFIASKPECFLDYEGENAQRFEKNWVPFEYEGQLLLAYSLLPHRILLPLLGKEACETVAISQGAIPWNWGALRGGTQALLDTDHYLGFFHSWKDMPTVQSNGKKISHYFIGAYTFEAKPPFAITAISPEPIVADDFYQPPYYRTWKPMRCIFPAGIVLDEKYVWVAYGRQDREIWIAKLDKKGLMDSLIPIK